MGNILEKRIDYGYDTTAMGVVERKNDNRNYEDTRVRLYMNENQIRNVQTWQMMALESGKITSFLVVLAPYLCRGETPISPDMPGVPIDELTANEMEEIAGSEAYKMMKRFSLNQLKAAVGMFIETASAGFQP